MSGTLRAEVLRQSRRSEKPTRDCERALERIVSLDPSRREVIERQRRRADSSEIAITEGFAVMGGDQLGEAQSGEFLLFIREEGDWKVHPTGPG